jgi:hypothetical protein
MARNRHRRSGKESHVLPSRKKAALAIVPLMFTLAACGGDDSASPPPPGDSNSSPGPGSPGSTPQGTTIKVTFSGNNVTPSGERIEVEHGRPVTLLVTADKPGEIHVHSTPEQELEYKAGHSELPIVNLDQPGVVDVESHNLDKVIVQLQVE